LFRKENGGNNMELDKRRHKCEFRVSTSEKEKIQELASHTKSCFEKLITISHKLANDS